MGNIINNPGFVLLILWSCLAAINIVFCKTTLLSHERGTIDKGGYTYNANIGDISQSKEYTGQNIHTRSHRQVGVGPIYSDAEKVRNAEIQYELAPKPSPRRRLKVPARIYRLLSEYEQKASGIPKKVVTSSIVGLMQESQPEDEEQQSRRLKVSTSIYNWLVAHQEKLEKISELPPNFPSLESKGVDTETPSDNAYKNKLFRCPIGNKTCQLLHMGL